ncbi:MAG: hypothetical protein MN733_26605 [Nitrososphaera sp.]|nr:hypothetical protein [Nitrososphaera sp.]
MNRIDRGFATAADAAKLVMHSRYRVGAALFKGGRLVSIGFNCRRTHPKQNSIFRWQHAECNCLLGTRKYDLRLCTLFVVRITRRGKFRVSTPCSDCQDILRAAGVRHIYHINRAGERAYLRL